MVDGFSDSTTNANEDTTLSYGKRSQIASIVCPLLLSVCATFLILIRMSYLPKLVKNDKIF